MRIVFASLGSLGDLHPMLALARTSLTRGHTVSIAASEVYREYVTSLGFPFHAIRPDLQPDPELVRHLSHPNRGPERLLREEVFPSVRETYEDLVAACSDADFLVVGELLYVAPLVAAKLEIPWANTILSPASFLSVTDPGVLGPAPWIYSLRHFGHWTHRSIFALGRFLTSRWSEPLREFRRELGFPPGPSPVFEGKHSPWLVLTMFPHFLAEPQPDWPGKVVQTGFPYFSQPDSAGTAEKLNAFLDAGDPPVVFTLGSSVVHIAENFYTLAAEAAAALGRRAILLAGKNTPPANLPGDILCISYAPLDTVLPRASVAVHHGGIGSCAESLRAGVPSLVIPFGYDQPDNAERLRLLGVAKVLRRNRISASSIEKSLRAILSAPQMAARARELSSLIDPAADIADSVIAIESAAAAPGAPLRNTQPAQSPNGAIPACSTP